MLCLGQVGSLLFFVLIVTVISFVVIVIIIVTITKTRRVVNLLLDITIWQQQQQQQQQSPWTQLNPHIHSTSYFYFTSCSNFFIKHQFISLLLPVFLCLCAHVLAVSKNNKQRNNVNQQ